MGCSQKENSSSSYLDPYSIIDVKSKRVLVGYKEGLYRIGKTRYFAVTNMKALADSGLNLIFNKKDSLLDWVEVSSDRYGTAAGISINDTKDQVRNTYGNPKRENFKAAQDVSDAKSEIRGMFYDNAIFLTSAKKINTIFYGDVDMGF